MKWNTKAEMGVGTLIIFIAMLLVAAVAAGVLLQTAGSLQQKALATGQASRGEISTNARVIEVSATNGQDRTLDNFSMQMKLSPGSEPIKLEEVTITMNTDNSTTTLTYMVPINDSVYCGTNGTAESCFSTGAGSDTGEFTVQYLVNGSNHIAGNLQRGDVVRVFMQAPREIGEDEHMRINFIPKIGTPTLVEFNTPDVISTQRAYVYP